MVIRGIHKAGSDHKIRGRLVDGHGDVIDLCDPHQGFHIRVMGLGRQRIREKYDEIDLPFHDLSPDLLVTAQRAQNGLKPRAEHWELSRVARYKSADMAGKRYFSHESPTYGSPYQMMRSFGISFRSAGENIAYGQRTPAAVVAAWMNSSGHRANILNSSYTQIGVGYHEAGNYWTQMFIG